MLSQSIDEIPAMQPEATLTSVSQHQSKGRVATINSALTSKRIETDSAPEERAFKKQRLYEALEDIITIVAGEGDARTTFVVHKRVLCAMSSFFQTACKIEWMKPEEKVIELPEDSPEAVRTMIYCMYHNVICVPESTFIHSVSDSAKDSMETGWGLFAQLFVLAEKYRIRYLKNRCMDAFLQYRDTEEIDFGVVPFVYENTPSGSPLRRFFVEAAVDCMTSEILEEQKQRLTCAEFSLDILSEIIKGRIPGAQAAFSGFEDPNVNFCEKFHVHGARGCKCKKLTKYLILSQNDF